MCDADLATDASPTGKDQLKQLWRRASIARRLPWTDPARLTANSVRNLARSANAPNEWPCGSRGTAQKTRAVLERYNIVSPGDGPRTAQTRCTRNVNAEPFGNSIAPRPRSSHRLSVRRQTTWHTDATESNSVPRNISVHSVWGLTSTRSRPVCRPCTPDLRPCAD